MSQPAYSRVLLKLSGEVLSGDQSYGIDPLKASELANEIKNVHEMGIGIALVIGAGNIFRGISVSAKGMDRVAADYLGMLATVMNSVALQSELEKMNCDTRVMSALSITQLAEPYIRRRATRHLEKGRVVICAGGTGNPYFTTDTAAALRASEIKCDILLKATKVDGIYDSDPKKNKNAKKLYDLSYDYVINKDLRVMDTASISLAKENNIPVLVFSIQESDSLKHIVDGGGNFTLIQE